jgi:hypothetical protein
VAYERSDDLILSLQAATDLLKGDRYNQLACLNGDQWAAELVTEVADVFVAWLRRPVRVTLGPPTIEEIPND